MKKFISNLYTWYWKEYRCRLEPWTHEWRRHVAKCWWVVLIKMGVWAGFFLWLLLFPLSNASTGVKIATMVASIVVVVFYAWLLLHLGGSLRSSCGNLNFLGAWTDPKNEGGTI